MYKLLYALWSQMLTFFCCSMLFNLWRIHFVKGITMMDIPSWVIGYAQEISRLKKQYHFSWTLDLRFDFLSVPPVQFNLLYFGKDTVLST